MDFLIFNANVLTPDGKVLEDGSILVKRGKIAKIGRKPSGRLGTMRLIDANGYFAAPGFIDLQVYGDPKKVASHEAMFGTTGFLATVPCLSPEATSGRIDAILNELASPDLGAKILGINLEGPYLSRGRSGAQNKRAMRRPDKAELRGLIKRSKGHLKFMTVAPELKGAPDIIKALVSKKVTVSIGHTKASFEETKNAVDLGANCATHVFNAMDGLHHRQPRAIEVILKDQRVSATVILDGEHVSPSAFDILVKCKGKDKVILITDSLRNDVLFDTKWDGGVYKLKDGTIAGSGLTMVNAVKNAVGFGGLSLPEAVKMASGNPAELLGLKSKGRLGAGCDADITIFDTKYDVWLTMTEGRIVYKRCAG